MLGDYFGDYLGELVKLSTIRKCVNISLRNGSLFSLRISSNYIK